MNEVETVLVGKKDSHSDNDQRHSREDCICAAEDWTVHLYLSLCYQLYGDVCCRKYMYILYFLGFKTDVFFSSKQS